VVQVGVPRWVWLAMLGLGLLLVAAGWVGALLSIGAAYLAAGKIEAADVLVAAVALALGAGQGLVLSAVGLAGWRGRQARSFRPLPVGRLSLVLACLLAIGAAASAHPVRSTILFPVLHVMAMAAMPLLVLSLVGRTMEGEVGSWRAVLASMGLGGSLSVAASLVAEIAVGLLLGVVLVGILLLTPEGRGQVAAAAEALLSPTWAAEDEVVTGLVVSPPFVAAAIGMLSIPVPIIEEFFKSAVVIPAVRWLRPSPARSFFWGVATGAGFALGENMLNGSLAVGESWTVLAIARFGATAMHCLTGGLVGWGVGQYWGERNWSRPALAYALAVALHAVWNACAVGMGLLSAGELAGSAPQAWPVLARCAVPILLSVLGVLLTASFVALANLARRLPG
jgi:hypothetical protein